MPYADLASKNQVKKVVEALKELKILNIGTATYLITMVMLRHLKLAGRSYANFSAAMGAFSCAANELYRRVISKYEDGKKQANGDVYKEDI